MTMVKTLVALATERMLLKTSGPTFLRGIEFMYAAGLAPERLSVMMTSSHKFVLQFHSKCDIRPFAANYPNFARVLRGIVHVRAWRIKSIEFVNVAFHMRDVENLERAIEKLEVELVLLRNCTYPGVSRGDEAVKFLSALNRKKQAVVCEYGDDRLKHRISRRNGSNRARRPSRLVQEVPLARLNAENNDRAAEREPALPQLPQPPAQPPLAGIAPPPPLPRNYQERFDPQVLRLAVQLLNDQQAQLQGILQAQRIPLLHGARPVNLPPPADQQDQGGRRVFRIPSLEEYYRMMVNRHARLGGSRARQQAQQQAAAAAGEADLAANAADEAQPINLAQPRDEVIPRDLENRDGSDSDNEEMELDDDVGRIRNANEQQNEIVGHNAPEADDTDDDLEEAREGDNDNQGVGHDVLEQIMRDEASFIAEY